MKKYLIPILFFALLLFGVAQAKDKKDGEKNGKLSVSAGVSVYNIPGDGSSLLMEIAARYHVSDKFITELSVGWTQYTSSGATITLIPVQLNGEFHPLGDAAKLNPYVGAGVGVYLTKTNEAMDATAGLQGIAGLSCAMGSGLSLNIEAKYILSDISNTDSGTFTYGGGIEGNWETAF